MILEFLHDLMRKLTQLFLLLNNPVIGWWKGIVEVFYIQKQFLLCLRRNYIRFSMGLFLKMSILVEIQDRTNRNKFLIRESLWWSKVKKEGLSNHSDRSIYHGECKGETKWKAAFSTSAWILSQPELHKFLGISQLTVLWVDRKIPCFQEVLQSLLKLYARKTPLFYNRSLGLQEAMRFVLQSLIIRFSPSAYTRAFLRYVEDDKFFPLTTL